MALWSWTAVTPPEALRPLVWGHRKMIDSAVGDRGEMQDRCIAEHTRDVSQRIRGKVGNRLKYVGCRMIRTTCVDLSSIWCTEYAPLHIDFTVWT